MLALGAYHHLLPIALRRRTVIEHFDVPRFVHALARLQWVNAPEALVEELQSLLKA